MRPRTFWILPVVVFVVDRVLKAAALQGLSLSAFGGALSFGLFRNGGIAFSLPASGPIVWAASLLVLGAVGAAAWRDWQAGSRDHAAAYLLFALGAVSNLIDRVAWGFTDDYLIFFGISAVNLADGMILLGAAWLALATPKRK